MHAQGYRSSSSLHIGQLDRYIIKYKLYDHEINNLSALINPASFLNLQVKNTVHISLRAAGLINGPYTLYCEVRPESYHHAQHIFATANQPKFEPNLQPQQSFQTELLLNNFTESSITWCVDVISQTLLTSTATITYDLSVEFNDGVGLSPDRLHVTKLNVLDLWELPISKIRDAETSDKDHLVILTHGLMSNLTADMVYLKEQIEQADPHCIVTGYHENVCKTERGVKYQGIKLAEFVMSKVQQLQPFVKKISFVGHSLGGLIQTFAISYVNRKHPEVFEQLVLENFIALATPFMGIFTDNPKYVQLSLAAGVVGKTGVDLGLSSLDGYNGECLLSLLPCAHTRNLLRKFKRRTIYANAINDGVVPLYTSCLLYVEYETVLDALEVNTNDSYSVQELKNEDQHFIHKNFVKPLSKLISLFAPQVTVDPSVRQFPKLSMLDTASHVLLQPIPSLQYIMNPQCRRYTILHDKVYTHVDVEKIREAQSYTTVLDCKKNKKTIEQVTDILSGNCDDAKLKEEVIANRWHENLTWRKVIVGLQPDAHNNIVVRRRFINAYGWQVVDHLTSEHFRESTKYEMPSSSSSAIEVEAETDVPDFDWLLEPYKQSVFDIGATGLISSVGDFVDNWTTPKIKVDNSVVATKGVDSEQQPSLFQYVEREDLDLLGV